MTRPIKIIAGRGGDSPASTQLGRRLLKVLVAHGPWATIQSSPSTYRHEFKKIYVPMRYNEVT